MRVGVEEPDAKHLLQRGAQQLLGQAVAVDGGGGEPLGVRQCVTLEALLHEQTARAQVLVDLGNPDATAVTQEGVHLDHRVGLTSEVELSSKARGEVVQHLRRPDALTELCPALRQAGQE